MLKPIEKHDQNDQTTLSNNRRQTVSSDPNEELIREREMCFDLFDDRSCRRCKRYIVFAKVNLRGIKRIPWHGGKDELARILSIGYYGNTFSYVVVKRRGEGRRRRRLMRMLIKCFSEVSPGGTTPITRKFHRRTHSGCKWIPTAPNRKWYRNWKRNERKGGSIGETQSEY